MLRESTALICLGIVGLAAAGCGGSGRPDLVTASGKVTLNGEALEGAIVAFQPIAEADSTYRRPSRATTDAQGNFALGTYAADDGIPLGRYRVTIQKREPIGEPPEDYGGEYSGSVSMKFKWITPRQLSDPATSGLEAEVTSSGLEPAVFELQSSGPPEIETTGPGRAGDEP